ncbi:polysaccharide pyruvyl transferase family protein [Microbacterium aoyamense]|uniref:polysaccharide pyruvyl transferase family protein n=1 Tax=Microbacterium aoyamense TaxID=344166 RepID=UPI002002F556|nr:polysaccharide pyruvyl transferase family protein [Microbacterium aoyamense]
MDDANFGNRLQNFALQTALQSLGYEVETIRNVPPAMDRGMLASRAWKALRKDGLVEFARRNVRNLQRRRRSDKAPSGEQSHPQAPQMAPHRREAAIAEFSRRHIVTTHDSYPDLAPEAWGAKYDVGVVGSDQVWNHGFRNAQEIDFLTFLPQDRRIAYAASFGVHDIPEFLRARYAAWLDGIPHIGVREQRGAEIVRELTGREVPVVVDPTLLFDGEQWRSFASIPPEPPQDRKGVQFFLGGGRPDQIAWVQRHAAAIDVPLVDLSDTSIDEVAGLDPFGFVRTLSEAEFVATDSFHTALFALQFQRPVIIRSRDETDSRLRTLLALHGIAVDATEVSGLFVMSSADWEQSSQLIAQHREKSWGYLRAAVATAAGRDSAP